jgi:hypothetical protein
MHVIGFPRVRGNEGKQIVVPPLRVITVGKNRRRLVAV